MTVPDVLPGLIGADHIQLLLIGLAEVEGYLLHCCGNEQHIRIHLLREKPCCQVLLDHRCRTAEVGALAHHGDSAAAAGDHHLVRIQQRLDGIDLHDGLRCRRGNDTLELAVRYGNDFIARFLLGLRLLAVHDLAHALHRIVETGIIGIHHHLGQNRGNGLVVAPLHQLRPDGVLEIIADHALAHGRADRKRRFCILLTVVGAQVLHGRMDHAHLQGIGEDNGDLIAGLHEVTDHHRSPAHCLQLLRQAEAQTLVTEGNDHSFFTHRTLLCSSTVLSAYP